MNKDTKILKPISEDDLTKIIEEGIRIRGRIIRLSQRGFGFISTEQIPFNRIFFHWSNLETNSKIFYELKVGDEVEFEVFERDRGLTAGRIKSL